MTDGGLVRVRCKSGRLVLGWLLDVLINLFRCGGGVVEVESIQGSRGPCCKRVTGGGRRDGSREKEKGGELL